MYYITIKTTNNLNQFLQMILNINIANDILIPVSTKKKRYKFHNKHSLKS